MFYKISKSLHNGNFEEKREKSKFAIQRRHDLETKEQTALAKDKHREKQRLAMKRKREAETEEESHLHKQQTNTTTMVEPLAPPSAWI